MLCTSLTWGAVLHRLANTRFPYSFVPPQKNCKCENWVNTAPPKYFWPREGLWFQSYDIANFSGILLSPEKITYLWLNDIYEPTSLSLVEKNCTPIVVTRLAWQNLVKISYTYVNRKSSCSSEKTKLNLYVASSLNLMSKLKWLSQLVCGREKHIQGS